jgi:hypothetical protein
MTARLIITHLSHDLQAKKSFVSFVWSDDPAKRLELEVPYGTALEGVEQAARKAVDDLGSELAASALVLPEAPGL